MALSRLLTQKGKTLQNSSTKGLLAAVDQNNEKFI